MTRRSRHIRLAGLLAIFALAAGLRLVTLDRAPLWADEIFSLAVATGHSIEHPAAVADPARGDYVEPPGAAPASYFQSFLKHDSPAAGPARVVRATFLSDTSPPLYYLLLWGWTQAAGTSDAALRGFSTLWALLCFPVLLSVARQLGGRAAVIPAALLFALSPLCLYYSNEGRMYSLVWFLVLCLMWLTLHLCRHGATPWATALWVLVAAAGLLTHYFFAFVLAACGLWLLIFPGPRLHRAVPIGCGIVVGLLVAPWYIHLPESVGNWRVTAGWLEVRPYNYKPVITFGKFVWSYVSSRGDWGSQAKWDLLVLTGIVLLLILLAPRLPQFLLSRRRLLLIAIVAAAVTGPVLLDFVQGTYLVSVPRYAMAALPAALILLGIGISWLRWWGQGVVYLLILVGWLPAMRRIVVNYNRMEQPYRQIAGSMSTLDSADTLIVHSIPTGIMGLARYLPPEQPLVAWTGQLGQREVPRDLVAVGAGQKRIVVVKVHDVWSPAVQAQWLNGHARMERETWNGYAQIFYYVPRGKTTFFPNPATH